MLNMNNYINILYIFSRVFGIIIIAPILGSKNVPRKIKIGLSFLLSLILFNLVPIIDTPIISIYYILYYMIIEFVVGLSIGFIVILVMTALYLAGLLIDRNMGFFMAQVVNPMAEGQISLSANLLYILSMIIFLMFDFHHLLIKALVKSYDYIPIGVGLTNLNKLMWLVNYLDKSFEIGIQIAAPFILTILISNVLLGVLSKAMPGMNVFIIGLPLKVFIGLMVFSVSIPYLINILREMFTSSFEYIHNFMGFL